MGTDKGPSASATSRHPGLRFEDFFCGIGLILSFVLSYAGARAPAQHASVMLEHSAHGAGSFTLVWIASKIMRAIHSE